MKTKESGESITHTKRLNLSSFKETPLIQKSYTSQQP